MSDESEDWVATCWYTGDDCPQCENAILATNGWTVWCEFCGYSRRSASGPLDSEDNGAYEGHLPGLA